MSKQCPLCKFNIPNDAVVCGHCGAIMHTEFDRSFLSKLNSAFTGFFIGSGISLVLTILLVNILPEHSWFSVFVLAIAILIPPVHFAEKYWKRGSIMEFWTKR